MMLDQARYDADHDGLTGALSRTAFRAGWTGSPLARATRAPPACCSSTSTTSVRSTRPPVTPPAMPSCAPSSSGCGRRRRRRALGRLGGDEFAAIVAPTIPGARPPLLAELNARRPRRGPAIDASAGMALIPRDGDDADGLLRAVDVALRVAKRTGRRRCRSTRASRSPTTGQVAPARRSSG